MYVYIIEINKEYCEVNESANAWDKSVYSSYKKADKRVKDVLKYDLSNTFKLSGKYETFTSHYSNEGHSIIINRERVN